MSDADPELYSCTICLDLLCRPVTLPCCHQHLCFSCLKRSVDICTSECPLCRKRIVGWTRRAQIKVNEDLWQKIKSKYPQRSKRRVQEEAEESGREEIDKAARNKRKAPGQEKCDRPLSAENDASFEGEEESYASSSKRILVAPEPGELREELAQRQDLLNQEIEKKRKAQEAMTFALIKSNPELQREAQRQKEQWDTMLQSQLSPRGKEYQLEIDRRIAEKLQQGEQSIQSKTKLSKQPLFTLKKKMPDAGSLGPILWQMGSSAPMPNTHSRQSEILVLEDSSDGYEIVPKQSPVSEIVLSSDDEGDEVTTMHVRGSAAKPALLSSSKARNSLVNDSSCRGLNSPKPKLAATCQSDTSLWQCKLCTYAKNEKKWLRCSMCFSLR